MTGGEQVPDSMGVRRAVAALTVAAFLTLLVDVGGGRSEGVSLLPGFLFTVAATSGFGWVERRRLIYPVNFAQSAR